MIDTWIVFGIAAVKPLVNNHTHEHVGGNEGSLYAFESVYAGLVEAEPDLRD